MKTKVTTSRGHPLKFWKTTEKVGVKKYIHLHCDIKYLGYQAGYLGIMIKIKQIGKSYFKPILGVTDRGKILWSKQTDWKKKYTTTKKDTVRLTRVHRKGIKKVTLVVPGENCGKEKGLYRCCFYVQNKRGGQITRIENTLDLNRMQCKVKKKKKKKIKKKKTHGGGRIRINKNVNNLRRKTGSKKNGGSVNADKNTQKHGKSTTVKGTPNSNSKNTIIIAVGSASIGFLIVLSALCCLWYKKRKEALSLRFKTQMEKQVQHPRQTTNNKPPNNRPTTGGPLRPHQRARTQQGVSVGVR